MLYTFRTVAFIEGQKDHDGFQAWLVSLNDDKGLPVTIEDGRETFYLAEGYVKSAFTTKRLNFDLIPDSMVYTALSKATFDCSLLYKKEGETFTAKVAQGLVNTGTKAKPKWVTPKVGEDYIYQETGIMPDWSKTNFIQFPENVMKDLAKAIKEAEMDERLYQAKIEMMKQAQIE